MTLTQLEYILAIERTKNFSKAAEECRVTQPSLSTQVMKLEEELALRIFDRDRRQVKVTDAGREILLLARRVLDEAQRIREAAQSYLHAGSAGTDLPECVTGIPSNQT